MLALNIKDIKDFMNKLLVGNIFDSFWLTEAAITTFNTFHIDGTLHQDFFDSDTLETLSAQNRSHSLWRDVKPYCYSMIKEKRTPLNFKIIFQLPAAQTEQTAARAMTGAASGQIKGMYLNLQYKNDSLLCTTGVSFSAFFPDKRPEQAWDNMILGFFQKHQIIFEKL